MSARPMHKALQVSDVLHCIFELLEDNSRALYAAVMVNRAWAFVATAILWRHPTAGALIALSAERRQHLAGVARSLTVDSEMSDLEAAILDATELPRVTQLRLRTGLIATDVIQGRCPTLQHLRASSSSQQCGWTDDTVPVLLQQFARGEVHGPQRVYFDRRASFDTLVRLAIFGCAQTLHLGPLLLSHTDFRTLAVLAAPFGRLRTLDANCWASALPALAPLIPHVRHLRLTLAGYDATALPALALALPDLLSLQLSFGRFAQLVPAKQLVLLGRLAALEALELDCVTDMADADMAQLVAGLPRLRRFRFGLYPRLTPAVLVTIGQRCRCLQDLWTDGPFALHELAERQLAPLPGPAGRGSTISGAPVLFPELRLLCALGVESRLGGVAADAGKVAPRMLRVLAKHAPKLETLRLRRGSKVDEAVLDGWRKTKG